MDEQQLPVCTIVLFADSYSPRQFVEALNVEEQRAQ